MSTIIDAAIGDTLLQLLRADIITQFLVDPIGDSSRTWCVQIKHIAPGSHRQIARRFGNTALGAMGHAITSAHSDFGYVAATCPSLSTLDTADLENCGEAWRLLIAIASETSNLQLASTQSDIVLVCGALRVVQPGITGESLLKALRQMEHDIEAVHHDVELLAADSVADNDAALAHWTSGPVCIRPGMTVVADVDDETSLNGRVSAFDRSGVHVAWNDGTGRSVSWDEVERISNGVLFVA